MHVHVHALFIIIKNINKKVLMKFFSLICGRFTVINFTEINVLF